MERNKVHIAMAAGGLIVFALALIPLFGNVEARLHEQHVEARMNHSELRLHRFHELYSVDTFSGFGTHRNTARAASTLVNTKKESEAEATEPAPPTIKPEAESHTDTAEQSTSAEVEAATEDIEEIPVVEIETEEEVNVSDEEPVLTSSLSDEAEEFLTLHNEVRDEHGLQGLTWSDDLAEGAADWADTLAGESCEMRHSDEPYGENLFIQWSTNPSVQGTPEDAVTWWADEEEYYSYDTNTCESGEVCGHYTQIVWEETTELGCAATRCSESGKTTDLFVCRYSPQGNIIGEKPY